MMMSGGAVVDTLTTQKTTSVRSLPSLLYIDSIIMTTMVTEQERLALLRASTPTGGRNKYYNFEQDPVNGLITVWYRKLWPAWDFCHKFDEYTVEEWAVFCWFESYSHYQAIAELVETNGNDEAMQAHHAMYEEYAVI